MYKAVYSNVAVLVLLGTTWSPAWRIGRGVGGLLRGDSVGHSGLEWIGGGSGVMPIETPA